MSATESLSHRSRGFDLWPDTDILATLWESQLAAVAAVQGTLGSVSRAAEATVARLREGEGRIVYAGAGSSGMLAAQDAMELTPTFGWPAERLLILMAGGDRARLQPSGTVEDDARSGAAEVTRHTITDSDVVIGVAASGTTPYTLSVVERSRAAGALTVAVVNNRPTPLAAAAEHAIEALTGAEVIAGSTRLKAGTAQKAILGMLSTLVMTRLGHVVDGWMVSLHADNAKLLRRAQRMVAAIAGVDDEAATLALQSAGGRVKPAVLVASGLTPDAAHTRLAAHDGDLRRSLATVGEGAD